MNISSQILFVIVLPIVLMLLVMAYAADKSYKHELGIKLQNEIKGSLFNIGNDLLDDLTNFEEKLKVAATFANTDEVYLHNLDTIFKSLIKTNSTLLTLSAISTDGNEWLRISEIETNSESQELQRSFLLNEKFFKESLMRDDIYIGKIKINSAINKPIIEMSIPLKDKRTGEVTGMLLGEFLLQNLQKTFISETRDGAITLISQHGKLTELSLHKIKLDEIKEEMLRKNSILIKEEEYKITKEFVYFKNFATDIYLLTPTRHFESEIESMSEKMRFVIYFSIGTIMVVMFLFARYLSNRLKQTASMIFEKISGTESITGDELSTIKGAFLLFHDEITKRQMSIENLNMELKSLLDEKQKQLLFQSRQAAIGEMLSMIAHQWRQPLNVLSMLGYRILERFEGHKEYERTKNNEYKLLKDTIAQMSQTIDDFSGFLKPVRDKTHFNPKEAIEYSLKMLEPVFQKQNIEINAKLDDEVTIFGHKNELIQVLLNIFGNAKDALSELQEGRERVMYVSLQKIQDSALISIRDSGDGIKDEMLERIFDPYISTKGEQGTGLGLYMSKVIIEEHMGGKIVAKNQGGALFEIYWPISSWI